MGPPFAAKLRGQPLRARCNLGVTYLQLICRSCAHLIRVKPTLRRTGAEAVRGRARSITSQHNLDPRNNPKNNGAEVASRRGSVKCQEPGFTQQGAPRRQGRGDSSLVRLKAKAGAQRRLWGGQGGNFLANGSALQGAGLSLFGEVLGGTCEQAQAVLARWGELSCGLGWNCCARRPRG